MGRNKMNALRDYVHTMIGALKEQRRLNPKTWTMNDFEFFDKMVSLCDMIDSGETPIIVIAEVNAVVEELEKVRHPFMPGKPHGKPLPFGGAAPRHGVPLTMSRIEKRFPHMSPEKAQDFWTYCLRRGINTDLKFGDGRPSIMNWFNEQSPKHQWN